EPHVDHVIAVPKILYLASVGLFRDFRAGAALGVLLTSGVVALLMIAARRRRGRASYADAALPLLSLNWGRAGALVFGDQLQFTASVALQGLALALMLRRDGPPSRRAALALGAV